MVGLGVVVGGVVVGSGVVVGGASVVVVGSGSTVVVTGGVDSTTGGGGGAGAEVGVSVSGRASEIVGGWVVSASRISTETATPPSSRPMSAAAAISKGVLLRAGFVAGTTAGSAIGAGATGAIAFVGRG